MISTDRPMNPRTVEFERLLAASRWKQIQAAKELGVTPSIISRYRKGDVVPSVTILRLFAALIGERLLLPGESQQRVEWDRGARWLEPWESEAAAIFRKIEPTRRARVINAVREIVDAIGPFPSRPISGVAHPEPEAGIRDKAQELIREVEQEHDRMIRAARKSGKRAAGAPVAPDPQ